MSFTPGQEAKLNELLDTRFTTFFDKLGSTIADRFEQQKRDTEKFTQNLLNTQLTESLKPINSSLEFVREVREAMEKEQSTPSAPTPTAPVSAPASTSASAIAPTTSIADTPVAPVSAPQQSPEFLKFQQETHQRMEELKKQVAKTEEMYKQERKQREETERAAKQSKMREEVLTAMRSNASLRPGTERQLLVLMEQEGLLTEHEGRYYVKGKDRFGDPINQELSEVLPTLLEKDYAHFAAARPGSGTGTSTSVAPKPSAIALDNLNTNDVYKMVQSGGDGLSQLFEQAKEIYG